MLRVTVNGQKYIVKWSYEEPGLGSRMTFCDIYKDDDAVCECKQRAVTGDTICHENDQFSKETGRKISLTRALKSLFPYDRESRKVFWQAYFNRKRVYYYVPA